LIESY